MSTTKIHGPVVVSDVMTAPVVTVDPGTSFRAIVQALKRHRISAVPVVDTDGRLLGIVSEADLLLKEADPLPKRTRLLEGRQRRLERAKAAGQSARELMTTPVVTVEPTVTLSEAARIMHEKGVKRLPVIDAQGHLVGMVSRADLLKAFLRPDAEIKREVLDDLITRRLRLAPESVEVTVHDGVVSLSGEIDRRSDILGLDRMVAEVAGVIGVRDDMRFRYDDTNEPIPPAWLGSFSRIELGDILDGYRIERTLGEGAFSAAYLGRSVSGRQQVAIKSLCPSVITDPNAHARFQRELAIMKRLSHPNIQRSLDTGVIRNQPYMVLEYVDGESFRNYLRRKAPLAPEEAVHLTMQLVDALDHMHSLGVVHRDLKPENLLRTSDGQLKVIDFGVAYMRGSRRLTWRWLSDALGTPGYMAPEQIQGKRGDRRADIYSLGILLFEMLSGRTPWHGDNPLAVMSQQLHTSPDPLRRYVPGVSPGLEAITSKMIRWRREERYQTVAEVRRDLLNWENLNLDRFDFAEERPGAPPLESAWRPWLIVAAGAALFLAGSGLGVLVTILARHP